MSWAGSGAFGAVRGLTTRGRAFVAVGLVCVLVAVLIGQRDLLRVGLLLTALPLISAWVVARARYRLACTRRLEPPRVAAGDSAAVALRLDNVSRLPTGLLLVEDRVPYLLGSRPRFVLERVEPRGHREVTYTVRSDVRGRFPLGPLSLRLTDPFGMCELSRSFTAVDRLTVTPQVHPLPTVSLGGEWGGSGESRARSLAAAGEDDIGTREYRYGDPLHRVHWRTTARRGEIMVRREEQPWQSRATVLLDSRARAHRGEGPGSSFEWAVSAAASIAVHLVRHGYAVRLLTDSGGSVSSAAHEPDSVGADFEGLLLDALAVIETSTVTGLGEVGTALQRGGGEGLLVAVLGALDLDQAQDLARLHRSTGTAVAVLLDVSSWLGGPPRPRAGVAGPALHAGQEAAASLLGAGGWRVIRVDAATSLAAVWPAASRSFGQRTATAGSGAGGGA